jgi:hypothetical protein
VPGGERECFSSACHAGATLDVREPKRVFIVRHIRERR